MRKRVRIALTGNPNVGKTTLFNAARRELARGDGGEEDRPDQP